MAAYVTTSKVEASAATATATITTPALDSLLIVVIVSSNSNSAGHTCSDNKGGVYTKDSNVDAAASGGVSIWHAPVSATGGSFVVTVGSSGAAAVVGLVTELAGMDLLTPTDGAGGTNTIIGAAILSTAVKVNQNSDDILMAGFGNNGGSTAAVQAPTNGWTRAGQETNGTNFMISESAYIPVKSPGAQQTTWTWTGNQDGFAVIMAYKAVGDTPPDPAPRPAQPRLAAIRTANVL